MIQVAKYYRMKKKKNLLYFIIFTLAVKHSGNSVWLKTTLTWTPECIKNTLSTLHLLRQLGVASWGLHECTSPSIFPAHEFKGGWTFADMVSVPEKQTAAGQRS